MEEAFSHAKHHVSTVADQVGQKFPAGDKREGEEFVNGLYNFAKLPGSLKDMVQLPGNAVTLVCRTSDCVPSSEMS